MKYGSRLPFKCFRELVDDVAVIFIATHLFVSSP